MIGILLNDASYEQDIRELLMAFYPGEGFAHERTGGVDFYVEGTYEPESGTFSLDILENEEKRRERHFPSLMRTVWKPRPPSNGSFTAFFLPVPERLFHGGPLPGSVPQRSP